MKYWIISKFSLYTINRKKVNPRILELEGSLDINRVTHCAFEETPREVDLGALALLGRDLGDDPVQETP